MRGLRFDRLMCGTALALPLTVVLAIPPLSAQANTQTPTAIESAVPMPERTTMAPPTAADTAAPSTTQGVGGNEPTATTAPAETAAPTETGTISPAAAEPAAPAPADTATAPAEVVDPLASLDPADRPLAEKLRDLLPKADRTFASRKERQAVEAFYQKRNYAPVWFERGAVAARTNAAITRVHASNADGLIPAEYKFPELATTAPEAQADAELRG